MSFTPNALRESLSRYRLTSRYVVALSGGLDSTVLLHAANRLYRRGGIHALRAVHVHHGLLPEADAWAEHCRSVCDQLDIPLETLRVDARPAPGESLEACARGHRYRAIADILEPGWGLLTGQHRQDQAETLLLQLFRGAGSAGLAAMPPVRVLGTGWHLRPLLDVPREALERYARDHGLEWIEDPSNAAVEHDRNYLRHRAFPVLKERWPSIDTTLARAAGLQAENLGLLEDLARLDEEGSLDANNRLSASALARLSHARQRNLLRYRIAEQGLTLPPRDRLETIRRQLTGAAHDTAPLIELDDGEIRRFGDSVYIQRPLPAHDPTWEVKAWYPETTPIPPGLSQGFEARRVRGRGLRYSPGMPALALRFRRGGERCRPASEAHRRTLKGLFQRAGIPPWLRDRYPLVYSGETLVAVAGLCIAEGHQAGPDDPGLEFSVAPDVISATKTMG